MLIKFLGLALTLATVSAFAKLPEVKVIKVDLDSKVVSVTTKDDSDVADSKIKELITEAGYNVASIERK